MTLPLVLLNRRRIGGFSPRAILAGSTALVLLDPSDLSTLFQDAAGTTPVTAPGQPVGRILDKSGNGFHATASGTSRPTYGVVPSRGRVNILNATATLATQTRPVTAAQHTLSFRGTGTVTLTGASTAGPLVGTGANDIVSLTFTPTAGNLTLTVSGTVNDAQLELGAARGTYQLVSDAGGFNITDPVGFPTYPCHYLGFDGVDDFMVTPTITPGADKVQVFAGVRKLSDAVGFPVVAEFGVRPTAGSFTFHAPSDQTTASYRFAFQGTAISNVGVATGYPAPITNVLTGLGDISGDLATLRIDGTQAAQSTADQGTGNFLAYPLYIGRRGGTSLPFNGQLFSLIVRFSTANLDGSLISQTERWMAQKTPGVTIA